MEVVIKSDKLKFGYQPDEFIVECAMLTDGFGQAMKIRRAQQEKNESTLALEKMGGDSVRMGRRQIEHNFNAKSNWNFLKLKIDNFLLTCEGRMIETFCSNFSEYGGIEMDHKSYSVMG